MIKTIDTNQIKRSLTLDSILNAVHCYYESAIPPKTEENMIRLRQLISAIIDREINKGDPK